MLAIIETIENDEDRALVESLYHKYGGFIVWIIKNNIIDKNKYEDLLQNTFIQIIRNLDVIKGLEDYKIKPYLKAITKNVCMDFLRKYNKSEVNDIQWEENHMEYVCKNHYNPEKIFEKREEIKEMWKILDKLSDRDRNIILYRYAYNMSYKEIAKEMKLSDKSINQFVKRAKVRLQRLLQEEV